jgi:tetratricopeptide (TPR) repeat protein
MALLSSFFMIYGLLTYIWLRCNVSSLTRRIVYIPLALFGFTLLGFKCKENAALLPGFIFLVELCILKFRSKGKVDKWIVLLFSTGFILLIGLALYQFSERPDWMTAGYRGRNFTLEERVLTQFRALIFYLSQIIFPSNSSLSLWHDDFVISTGFLQPISTLGSFILLIVLLTLAVCLIPKLPLIALGILWFFVSHSIESTVWPLELVHEHRNYLASFGVLLALGSLFLWVFQKREKTVIAVFLVIFCFFSFIVNERAKIWSDPVVHAHHEAKVRPNSGAALFQLGQHYYVEAMNGVPGVEKKAEALLEQSALNDQYNVVADLLLVVLSEHQNVEYQGKWLIKAAEKLKKYPFMNPSKAAIQGFYRCLKMDICHPPEEDLERFFRTLYKLKDKNNLNTVGLYYSQISPNPERSEKAFKRALSRKDVASWVNYLSALLHQEKKDKACSEYARFSRLLEENTFKNTVLYVAEISLLKNKLGSCL